MKFSTKKSLSVVFVVLMATILSSAAYAEVFTILNGKIVCDVSAGPCGATPTNILTPVTNQQVMVFPMNPTATAGRVLAIAAWANMSGVRYSITDTFTVYPSGDVIQDPAGTQLGAAPGFAAGGALILSKLVPSTQPAGRYDFKVAITDFFGNLLKNQLGDPLPATTFSVWVGETSSDFVLPNLDVRIAGVTVQTSSSPMVVIVNAPCRLGGSVNVFQGLPPLEGTLTNATCLDGQHFSFPLADLTNNPTERYISIVDTDGTASATGFFAVPLAPAQQ